LESPLSARLLKLANVESLALVVSALRFADAFGLVFVTAPVLGRSGMKFGGSGLSRGGEFGG
jgi:hypothetical protein